MTSYNANFMKDMRFPIALAKEPYFSYLLKLIDPYYNSIEKYNIFLAAIEKDGFDAFNKRNKLVMNSTLDYLTSKKEYSDFNNMNMERFARKMPIEKRELYHPDSVSKRFVSVDLNKANFQVFHYVCPTIFDGFDNYNDFMKSMGADDYILLSKIIRQVIFGNMNPQRQQKIQLFIMNTIAAKLQEHGVDMTTVYSMSSDELVFEASTHTQDSVTQMLSELPFSMRIEEFVLERPFVQPFYVKRFNDNSVDFKLVPTDSMAEFIKRFEGREVEEMDLYFYDTANKRMAKYLEPHIELKAD